MEWMFVLFIGQSFAGIRPEVNSLMVIRTQVSKEHHREGGIWEWTLLPVLYGNRKFLFQKFLDPDVFALDDIFFDGHKNSYRFTCVVRVIALLFEPSI